MNRLSTCAWIDTSSAATDSSQTRNSGFTASARAMPIRARCPPENWCGIAAHQRRVETDAVQLQPDVFDLRPRRAHPVRDRRLADDVDDAHPRIERRVRVLEDHLHLELLRGAPHRATSPASGAPCQ